MRRERQMTQAAFKVAVLRCCLMAMIGWPSLSEGQLKGRFYLDKESYTSGEPVFLYFKITNNSTVAYKVVVADPYSFCSQYGVHLSSDSGPGSACEPSAQPGSCVLSQALLGPGDSKTERILLNYDHELSRPENLPRARKAPSNVRRRWRIASSLVRTCS